MDCLIRFVCFGMAVFISLIWFIRFVKGKFRLVGFCCFVLWNSSNLLKSFLQLRAASFKWPLRHHQAPFTGIKSVSLLVNQLVTRVGNVPTWVR